jgi:hypothetical protein
MLQGKQSSQVGGGGERAGRGGGGGGTPHGEFSSPHPRPAFSLGSLTSCRNSDIDVSHIEKVGVFAPGRTHGLSSS